MPEQTPENPEDRDTVLMAELNDLTNHLSSALDRFRIESRLNGLAEKEIPDARQRLAHVLELTDNAAHRTLDLVEQSGPLAERTAREAANLSESWALFRARRIEPEEFRSLAARMDAFLPAARTDSETVRANLAEVLVAQDYQDLTGQIIRGVMTLVGEVEKTLADLTRLARGEPTDPESPDETVRTLHAGPVVPGVASGGPVVSDQQDVDALLSDLGM